MPQVHRKKCNRCKQVFESPGNKGCSCGSPDWKFTSGPLTRMKVDGIPVTIRPCTCSFCSPGRSAVHAMKNDDIIIEEIA